MKIKSTASRGIVMDFAQGRNSTFNLASCACVIRRKAHYIINAKTLNYNDLVEPH